MNATTAIPLPLGPLDPERSELLRRVVDGLPHDSLQWLSGFAAGVAYARSQGNVARGDAVPPLKSSLSTGAFQDHQIGTVTVNLHR